MSPEFRRDDTASRYLATEDGQQLGLIDFTLSDDRDKIVILHTETVPAARGRGIADQLTRFAVDDIREQGFKIVPVCPFTEAWFDSHPDETDILGVV
ncbi:hypothetical protein FHX74_003316 [Friedmanniella endophytica]|uniref:N-acetyltransferase domain-containing protein n=2 Tax=Microlunatus kandeliicorticis TaxID=1759536 RepID=A0A7W3IV07_9ACTN|nr:hypothetical protein [Microlunatus kandeliicorticis]